MQRYLIDHALENVWCNPQQDNQVVIAAKRLTRNNGELNKFTLMNRQVSLPLSGRRYHVYQIGQILPIALGLSPIAALWEPQRWIKFSDAMTSQKVVANIYNREGVNVPRYSSYYMFTDDRDLVFAVEIDKSVSVDFNNDVLYLRLYSNAYYQSDRGDDTEDFLTCNGAKLTTLQKIIDLQSEVQSKRALEGSVQCFVNGLLVDDISPVVAKVGDTAEYVYDSSVKRTVTFDTANLDTFTSILDNKYKYLLHHLNGGNDTIDYQDDIDVMVTHTASNGVKRGVYYHRNNSDSHRMVTHRDYSLVVDYYDYLVSVLASKINPESPPASGFKIEVVIRNSGYYRPLVFDNDRIFELYKLNDQQIRQAMTGLNSTLPIWRAENLENSAYTALMRSKAPAVTMELVQNAYGYNAMSKIVGDTPQVTFLDSSRQMVILPVGLRNNSTVYEYDADGDLLGFYYHASGSDYSCVNSQARKIEAISGRGTHSPEIVFGTNNLTLPQYDNYRVYMCFLVNGVPNNEWRDITGTNYYTVVNNRLVWANLEYEQYLMIRSDKNFLAYDVEVDSVDGTVSLVVTESENRGSGYQLYPLPVPMGELDLFLNGKSLINGLDYIVKFPKIHILNREFLAQPAGSVTQKVHVRFMGFCKPDLSFDKADDYGFVQHGFLSNNKRFDLRDDKVLRITVNGQLKTRTDVVFSENSDAVSIVNPANGKPYQVKDIVVPLKQMVDANTYTLREKSMIIDKQVADYLSLKLPQADRGDLMAITNRYILVSTFFSRVINAIANTEIPMDVVTSNLSDNEVLELCSPFEHLLAFDPINPDNQIDFKFVEVVPHRNNTATTLTLAQYRLLARIVKLYGQDRIDLTTYINFST